MIFNEFYAIYISIIVLCYLYFLNRNRIKVANEDQIITFVIICLILLAAMRPIEVPDTDYYKYLYENVRKPSLKDIRFFSRDIYFAEDYRISVEIGYSIFNYICKQLNIPFRVFLGIVAGIVYITSIKGYTLIQRYLTNNESSDPFGVLTAFLLYNGMSSGGVAIRAGLSIGFGVLAIGLFLNKKGIWKVVICFLLSITMHNGGLLFLPILVLLLFKITIRRKTFLIIWIFCLVFMTLNMAHYLYPIFMRILENLLETMGLSKFVGSMYNTVTFVPLRYWMKLFFGGLVAYAGYIKESKYANLTFIVMIGIMILGIAYPMRSSYRIIDYFYVFLIPYSFNESYKRQRELTLNKLLGLIGYAGLALVQVYMSMF